MHVSITYFFIYVKNNNNKNKTINTLRILIDFKGQVT